MSSLENQPDKAFTATMGTRYSPPKRFAYTQKVQSYVAAGGVSYSQLKFASPIPIGSGSFDQGWVKDSDWSFEA